MEKLTYKLLLVSLGAIVSINAFSAAINDLPLKETTYLKLAGGFSKANIEAFYTAYGAGGIVTQKTSFDDLYDSRYVKFVVGSYNGNSFIRFNHEVSVGKFFSGSRFTTPDGSRWNLRNNYDIAYQWMPLFSVNNKLDLYSILGLHYGDFRYERIPGQLGFNNKRGAFGLAIGAGANWALNQNFTMSMEVQGIQFQEKSVSGSTDLGVIGQDSFTPNYLLTSISFSYKIA